jgi:hypothetical protein
MVIEVPGLIVVRSSEGGPGYFSNVCHPGNYNNNAGAGSIGLFP